MRLFIHNSVPLLYTKVVNRAGLRHVRGVRPNRAADFRPPPFWVL